MLGIRRFLKKAVRKATGRSQASNTPAPARPSPPPTVSAPEPEPELEVPVEVDGDTVSEWLAVGEELVFIDIREPGELQSGHVAGALLIPMNHVPHHLDRIPKGKRLVVYCAAGGRSFGVTHYLREQGYDDSWSLEGGFGEYASGGHPVSTPPRDAKFPLTSRVQIKDDGRAGIVQAISTAGEIYEYTIAEANAGPETPLISGVAETSLERAAALR